MLEQDKEPQSLEGKTILVVEDDQRWQEMFSRCLTRGGYVVKTASDLEEAFEAWEKGKPDLVVTDLSMSIGDAGDEQGMELMDWIRKRDRLMPIIVVTAFSSIERMRRAFSSFLVDDFLFKGEWSSDDLLQTVREALDRSVLQRAEAQIARLEKENVALREEIDDLRRGKERHEEERSASRTTSKELEIYRSFIQSFLHDLNGELGGFRADIEEIRAIPGLPAEWEEAYEGMRQSLSYIGILQRRMRNLMALDEVALYPVTSAEIIQRIQSLAAPRMTSSVALSVDVKPSFERKTIKTDKEHVVGVVLELIQNASKVLSNDGGRIEVLAEGEDDKVIFSIKDNGPGIPEALRDVILKEAVPSERGSGFGLYLSRKVIEALGGTLRLASTSSEGTVFSISLPVSDTQEED